MAESATQGDLRGEVVARGKAVHTRLLIVGAQPGSFLDVVTSRVVQLRHERPQDLRTSQVLAAFKDGRVDADLDLGPCQLHFDPSVGRPVGWQGVFLNSLRVKVV